MLTFKPGDSSSKLHYGPSLYALNHNRIYMCVICFDLVASVVNHLGNYSLQGLVILTDFESGQLDERRNKNVQTLTEKEKYELLYITAKQDKIRSEQGYYQAVGMKW